MSAGKLLDSDSLLVAFHFAAQIVSEGAGVQFLTRADRGHFRKRHSVEGNKSLH